MDSEKGNGCCSSDEKDCKGKRVVRRHNHDDVKILKLYWDRYGPYPQMEQKEEIRSQTNLELDQIKYWFQNNRNKIKKVNTSNLLAKDKGKSTSKIDSSLPSSFHTRVPMEKNVHGYGAFHNPTLPKCSIDGITNTEKAQMLNTSDLGSSVFNNPILPENEKLFTLAASAMHELECLIKGNTPLWYKSTDGKSIIDKEKYKTYFPKASRFGLFGSHVESSRDSGIVEMNGIELVEMFLDSGKWADLFPSIISDARTLHVIENGEKGTRNECLQLMYEQLHILSPLVPAREYYFIRQCKQIDQKLWIIMDVSYDQLKESIPLPRSCMFPSGFMIQDMGNGNSNVVCVQHVRAGDEALSYKLLEDLTSQFGAEGWILKLRRMCERLALMNTYNPPSQDLGGVIRFLGERKNVMKLCHRMVKSFGSVLNMPYKVKFPIGSNSGIHVSIRTNTKKGQPRGMIVTSATSLCLPMSYNTIFNFLRDGKKRFMWDILCSGSSVNEIQHISTGTNIGNCISIFQPSISGESNMVILQESFIDPLQSVIVYAPMEISCMKLAIRGADPDILPSGFVISHGGHKSASRDATSPKTGGSKASSLLTLVYQIFASTLTSKSEESDISKLMSDIDFLVTTSVCKIESSLVDMISNNDVSLM